MRIKLDGPVSEKIRIAISHIEEMKYLHEEKNNLYKFKIKNPKKKLPIADSDLKELESDFRRNFKEVFKILHKAINQIEKQW